MLKSRPRSEFSKPFKLCSSRDDAIDQSAIARLVEYEATGDPSKLALREGVEPTWFVCEPLSMTAALVCGRQDTDELRHLWAFRYAVTAVENVDGEAVVLPERVETAGGSIIPEATMSDLHRRFGLGVICEVGSFVLDRAHLNEAEKKDSLRLPGSRRSR